MDELIVGELRVAPGERATRVFDVPLGERVVQVPVIAVNGAQPGPRVAVTGGIHGAEYVGIEAARRLGMGLDPGEMAGSVVIVPIANTAAYHARAIYTTALDSNNLNRVFPGDPEGAPSERLADWLFRTIIQPSDAYVDMHGGDMIEALVPFVIYLEAPDKEVEARSLAMAQANGIERIIRSRTAGSTYEAATLAGIPAILAEIGGQGVWSEEEVEAHRAGVERVLQHLGVLPGEPEQRPQRHYETFAWLRSGHDGLFHPLVNVGDRVQEGQLLGRVTDYFGNELEPVQASASGEIVFLVTSLAMNAGDPLLAIGA